MFARKDRLKTSWPDRDLLQFTCPFCSKRHSLKFNELDEGHLNGNEDDSYKMLHINEDYSHIHPQFVCDADGCNFSTSIRVPNEK